MTDWYKMTPLDWNKGTEKLTLEQESAYLRLCHAMYIQGGPISDNPFVLAGYFRSDTKKARRLLKELVEAGKVTVEDGEISNKRAMDVISSRDRLSVVRQTSAKRSRNVSETFSEQSHDHSETGDDKSLKNNNTSLANANSRDVLDKIREDKIRKDTSSLRSDVTSAREKPFDEFWKKYPSKVGKGAARSAFEKALKRTCLEELMTGLDRYVHKQDDRQWCNPSTWLNQERWSDVPAQVQPMRRPESEFARNNREFKEALEARIFGEKKNDDTFGSDGPSFDIGPDDFRIVR
jgi:uncharacterized protein YdaU (DUF1376 family)